MTAFSANLGFLWSDLALPDAIRAAAAAGFEAVECHWPYDTDPQEVRLALRDCGIPMLGLNTRRGNVAQGENGLSALPGRESEAKAAIEEAIRYACSIEAGAVHVMSGNAEGDLAHEVFLRNLRFACTLASQHGLTILIEPLNRFDAPGYFLRTAGQAREIIEALPVPNLKLMFDCYHVGRTEGDVIAVFDEMLPVIGHVQFASVPDRGAPDHGEVDYGAVFAHIRDRGWTRPLGAEYKPVAPTGDSLGWMRVL